MGYLHLLALDFIVPNSPAVWAVQGIRHVGPVVQPVSARVELQDAGEDVPHCRAELAVERDGVGAVLCVVEQGPSLLHSKSGHHHFPPPLLYPGNMNWGALQLQS